MVTFISPEVDARIDTLSHCLLAGADVTALQQFLVGEVRPPPAITGIFDGATRAALTQWQAAAGVPATGYFGDASRLAYLQGQARSNAAIRA